MKPRKLLRVLIKKNKHDRYKVEFVYPFLFFFREKELQFFKKSKSQIDTEKQRCLKIQGNLGGFYRYNETSSFDTLEEAREAALSRVNDLRELNNHYRKLKKKKEELVQVIEVNDYI